MSFAVGNNPVSARRIESRSSKISCPSNLRLPEANLLRIARGHGVEGVASLFGGSHVISINGTRDKLAFPPLPKNIIRYLSFLLRASVSSNAFSILWRLPKLGNLPELVRQKERQLTRGLEVRKDRDPTVKHRSSEKNAKRNAMQMNMQINTMHKMGHIRTVCSAARSSRLLDVQSKSSAPSKRC